MRPTRVGISLGDPGGVGPEITVRALQALAHAPMTPVIYGVPAAWRRAVALSGGADPLENKGEFVPCDDVQEAEIPYGGPHPRAGLASLRCLERATEALCGGEIETLCTAPLAKAAVKFHAPSFVGHTEFLQQAFGVPRVVMLMASPRLNVALATTHVALSEVPRLLTIDGLVETTALVARELTARFGLKTPRIALLGLNPHAGERGAFGDEEGRIIAPAIAQLRSMGIAAEGPFPADGLLPRIQASGFDAVVAMYHDQGLIPFKVLAFHDGVNVTLGLPRPRTSPDHGTAYDIAGKGVADARPMQAALALAARLAAPDGVASGASEP